MILSPRPHSFHLQSARFLRNRAAHESARICVIRRLAAPHAPPRQQQWARESERIVRRANAGEFVCCTVSTYGRQHLAQIEANDVQTLPLKRIQARMFATKFLVAEQAERAETETETDFS
jgi:hypothetical protein